MGRNDGKGDHLPGWLRSEKPDILYISTTDFVTHTHAPDTEPSRRNIREIDRLIGEGDGFRRFASGA